MSNRPLRKKENSNDKREIAYEMTEKMPLLKIYAKNIFFELGLQHRNHRDFMNEIWNENILCNEPCLKYHILWKISFISDFWLWMCPFNLKKRSDVGDSNESIKTEKDFWGKRDSWSRFRRKSAINNYIVY